MKQNAGEGKKETYKMGGGLEESPIVRAATEKEENGNYKKI